jgi:hypothetical protein
VAGLAGLAAELALLLGPAVRFMHRAFAVEVPRAILGLLLLALEVSSEAAPGLSSELMPSA